MQLKLTTFALLLCLTLGLPLGLSRMAGAQAAYVPSQVDDIANLGHGLNGARLGFGFGFETNVSGLTHVVVGIDSLTEGAFGTSYLDYFIPRIKAALGDGGPGYQGFDNNVASDEGATFGFNTSAGGKIVPATILSEINTDTVTLTGNAPYSFNRFGLDWASTTGAEFLNWDCHRNWDSVKIFYLIQPGGGSFRCYNGTGVLTTVSTNGTLALGSFLCTAKKNGGTSNLSIDQLGLSATTTGTGTAAALNGPVCMFGGYFFVANGGVKVTMGAKGGTTLSSYSNLNAAFMAQWWGNYSATVNTGGFGPCLYVLEGGTNDRNVAGMTAATFQANLVKVVNACQTNAANNTLIVRPTDINLADTNYALFNSFGPAYLNVAQNIAGAVATRISGYSSDRDVFGTITEANGQGLMQADLVHPTAKGNQRRASILLTFFGLPPTGGTLTAPLVAGKPHTQNADPFGVSTLAWNGNHLVYGSMHLWLDAGSKFRVKASVPTSDQDGAALNGGSPLTLAKAAAYTATPADGLAELNGTTAAFAVTLPDATTCPGAVLRFLKTDASANAITLTAFGAQTVNGMATLVLSTQYQGATLISNGTVWDKL